MASDALVTLHRSNRLASDTTVQYHRCNGPSNAQAKGEKFMLHRMNRWCSLMHRCKHHAFTQRACQAAEEKFFSTDYTGGHRRKAPV